METALRKWAMEDKEQLMALCNGVDRQYLSGRLPFPYTEKDAGWWLNLVQEQDGREGVFRAIVVDGRCVGNISVEKKSDVYAVDGEIGYLLQTESWSKGIMTEAVGQMCALAFSRLDILRITGLVYEPNAGSRKVLEKNGFLLEGIKRNGVYKDGRVYNLCIYGLLKEGLQGIACSSVPEVRTSPVIPCAPLLL